MIIVSVSVLIVCVYKLTDTDPDVDNPGVIVNTLFVIETKELKEGGIKAASV